MAVDIFLKLDPIKGELLDDKHKDEIDILSWSFGESQTGTFHSGSGGGAGKVSVQDLHFTHFVDKATPELFKVCAIGKHIDSAILTVRKAGENPLEYLKIEMKQVLADPSVSTGGSHGEDRLTENVSSNFAKVKMIYKTQTEKGGARSFADVWLGCSCQQGMGLIVGPSPGAGCDWRTGAKRCDFDRTSRPARLRARKPAGRQPSRTPHARPPGLHASWASWGP